MMMISKDSTWSNDSEWSCNGPACTLYLLRTVMITCIKTHALTKRALIKSPSPNVDKGTEIRLRQAEIHRQRRERKVKINHLNGEVKILDSASKSLASIVSTQTRPDSVVRALTLLRTDLVEQVNTLQSETWKEANTDRDYRWGPYEPDSMILEIHPFGPGMDAIINSIQAKMKDESLSTDSIMGDVKQAVEKEAKGMFRRKDVLVNEIKELERQESAKLTSDNMFKEGFNKTVSSLFLILTYIWRNHIASSLSHRLTIVTLDCKQRARRTARRIKREDIYRNYSQPFIRTIYIFVFNKRHSGK